jgi:MFS family permease
MTLTPDASSKSAKAVSVWVVCGAAIGLMFGFGPLFFSITTIFLKPMTVTFGWGRADVAMLPTFALVGTTLGAPIVGYLADRFGWSKVIAVSIVLFSIMMGALAVAPANHAYVITVGFLIGFLGSGTTPVGYLGVLPRLFHRRLGMALGFAMIGTGLGGVLVPIIANHIMNWRYWSGACALAALVVGFVAHRMMFQYADVEIRKHKGDANVPATAAFAAAPTFAQVVRSYRFWLLAIVMSAVSASILGAFVHLAAFATDRGLGRDVGAQATGLVGAGLAISRAGLGALLDRVFAPLVAFVTFCLGAAGFAIFLTGAVHTPALFLLASLLLGISSGSEGDLIPFLARKYFGQRSFGVIYGCLFGAYTIGGGLGPFLYGIAFDHFGSYIVAHEVSLAIGLAGAVAIMLLGRYPVASSERLSHKRHRICPIWGCKPEHRTM